MFTRHLAIEVGPHNIRANCIAPGTTTSERISRVMDARSHGAHRRLVTAGPPRHS